MRRDASENKRKIEEKAFELFIEHGVESITMKQISKELNIGIGTVYRHFEDKSALCYKLIENDFVTLFEQMGKIKLRTEDNKEQLIQYIDVFLNFKARHSQLLKCVEQTENEKFFNSEIFKELYKKFFELFKKDGNQKWCEFKTDMFLNALSMPAYEYQISERKLTNEQLRDYIVDLFY